MNPYRALLSAAYVMFLYQGLGLAQHGVEPVVSSPCAGVINTRVVSTLSVDEISKLGAAVSLQNSFGGLSLQPFDDDDRPRRGKEIEIGFILARSGDLGGTPVGLIVWSERNLNFHFTKLSDSSISVESSDLKNCHVLANFTLSEDGNVLRDRKVLGRAR